MSRYCPKTMNAVSRRNFLEKSALGFGAMAASTLLDGATISDPFVRKQPHFEQAAWAGDSEVIREGGLSVLEYGPNAADGFAAEVQQAREVWA